ncbi:MAG: hypothetical protein ACOCRK_10440 [bacterium]
MKDLEQKIEDLEKKIDIILENQKKKDEGIRWEQYPLILNAKQISEITDLNVQKIYQWFKMSSFPGMQWGRRLVVTRENLREWLEKQAG